jgi:hypothetical protein
VAQRTFLGNLRLAILLAVLVFVALGAWLDRSRSRDWDAPLRVTVYPIAFDGDEDVRTYAAALSDESFDPVEQFMIEEAQRHGLALAEPVRIRVSHAATSLPPAAPDEPGVLSVAWWSLRLRYWAWRVRANDALPPPDVQVFALLHATQEHTALPDSLGLSKGLVAVAHLFADPVASGSNDVVLVHELLHTLGATDKYEPSSGQPVDPDGLGEPERSPRYPQQFAEIMGGRIALSTTTAEIPASLDEVLVGDLTASEIGWSP